MRRSTKELLKSIHESFNMSPGERNQAIIEEQKRKFSARGGTIKRINIFDIRSWELNDIMCHGSRLEAVDFLRI